jgi:type I restriction enzyme, S subunit
MSNTLQEREVPVEKVPWPRVRVGDYCDARIETTAPEGNPDDEFIYVDISAVDAASKRITAPKQLLGRQASSRARQRLRTGDVIVSTVRPNLNSVAMVGPELDGAVGSTGFCVLRAQPGLDAEFLFAWVRSREFVGELSALVAGAMYPAVSDRQVRDQLVPLPPLSEQRRIARKLREKFADLDRARRALADQIDAAEKLSAATLREAFQGVEADKWPLHKLETLDSTRAGIVDGPFGSNLKTEHYRTKGPRVVRLQNIGVTDFIGQHKAFIASEHYQNLLYHAVAPGDVVVAALGDGARPAGRACRLPADFGEGIVKADCFRVRLPEAVIDPDFLVYFFNSPATLKDVAESMRGATRPRVTLGMLKARRIPVPDLVTQSRVARDLSEKLSVTRVLKTQLSAQLAALDRYPAALLCDAFAGRL